MPAYIKGFIGAFFGALVLLFVWCAFTGRQGYDVLQVSLVMSAFTAFFVTTMLRAKGIADGTVFQQLVFCAVVFGLSYFFLATIICSLLPPHGLSLPVPELTQSCLLIAAMGASSGAGFLIAKFLGSLKL